MTRDISYAQGERHTLDVCRPKNAAAAPVVVFFYGGGWRSGYKELYRYVGKALARRGYVAVLPLMVGLLAGAYPALRAARTSPLAALRHA